MPKRSLNTPLKLPSLSLILGGGTLSIIAILYLRHSLLDPNKNLEEKMGLLSGAALAFLVIGLAALRLARRPARRQIPLAALLFLGYVVPALIYLLPFGIRAAAAYPAHAFPAPQELAQARANVYIWQACFLTAWQALRLLYTQPMPAASLSIPHLRSSLIPGFLTGLGLWLMIVFLVSLQVRLFNLQAALFSPAAPPLLLQFTAVALAPFGVQAAYRLQLEGAPNPSPSRPFQPWKTALLFALTQVRPLLFLPAFLAGLVFAWLFSRNRSLIQVITGHIIINLLMLYFNWQMVI